MVATVMALGLIAAGSGTASADDCSASGCHPPSCTGDQATSANWCTEPLYLHKGTVQHNPRVYLIFWGSKWRDQAPQNGYPSYLANTVFGRLRGTAFNNILTQYSDAKGPVNNTAVLAGWDVDTSAVPPMSEAEIVSEIDNEVSRKSWSATDDTQFIVFPQPGSDVSGLGSYCGRHFMRQLGASGTAAWVVYPTDQQGCSSGDDKASLTATALHEYAETVTDPQGLDYSLVPTNVHGYATDDPHPNPIEIADKCAGWSAGVGNTFNVSLPLLWNPAVSACTIMHGQDYPTTDPGWSFHTVYGEILKEYAALGATSSVLGKPVSEEQGVSTGRVSYFAGASCGGGGPNGSGSAIYWTSGPAHEVQGCIYHEYVTAAGGPGVLGFPVTDEQPAAGGGRENLFSGTGCGAATGSAILFTSATGAHKVQGCIYQDYLFNGGPGGALGYPITDEQGISTGRISNFAGTSCTSGSYQGVNSAILFTPATGSNAVQGCIYQTYIQAMGGPGGVLGFPITDETPVSGGSYNYFAGTSCASGAYQGSASAIVWNASAGSAFNVQGCIFQLYLQAEGGPGGSFGLPTSGEHNITSGYSLRTGKINTFTGTSCNSAPYTGSGSAIYWNPVAGAAYEVQGCIYQAFLTVGGASGRLGLPTSSEHTIGNAGDRQSDFEGGHIIWTRATGTVNVYFN